MVTNVTKEWLLGESGTDGANANVGITGVGSGSPKYHNANFPAGMVLNVQSTTITTALNLGSVASGGTVQVTGLTVTITPKVGDFYFFTHYLMHTVFPFKGSDEERRSISFNAFIDENIYNVYDG